VHLVKLLFVQKLMQYSGDVLNTWTECGFISLHATCDTCISYISNNPIQSNISKHYHEKDQFFLL